MTEVEKRLARLEVQTLTHGTRLDDHDARFGEVEGAAREKLRRKSARNVAWNGLSGFRTRFGPA